MSLHARLHPDAQRALDAQRRRSTAASIVLAVLGINLIALGLAYFALENMAVRQASIIVTPPREMPDDPPLPPRPLPVSARKPAAPRSMSDLLHVPQRAEISVPRVDTPTEETGLFPGNDDDFGDGGLGTSDGGDAWTPIPADLRKRCSPEDRLAQLQAGGGTAAIEEHVVRALRYLKQTQAPDGGWGSDHRAAMTGLSVLAYLGHCETPLSEEFGDSCLRAITFLIDRAATQHGRFSAPDAGRHWPYEQAIATYALAEAQTFCRSLNVTIPQLTETVQKSGQLLIDRQHESGGWDYDYEESSSRGGDLSITAWHVQALKACKLTGIDFRNLNRSMRRALDYVAARQAADGSFGYTGTAPAGELPRPSLTGAGMLCFQMLERGDSAIVRRGARHALANSPFVWDGADCDLYAHYYLSQAMFQRGGDEWAAYQPRIRDSLTARQAADGSWPKPGGGGKVNAVGARFTDDTATGRHYRVALATLMLEVYYRYLPASQ